ncbi:DNA-directed RNA polymerase subunit alpha [Candidatus Gottesmanbacteria bacterium RIFCSPHIGHO2_02_FULL_39_11]|uniref:DNA-directed RNA polymerase subunit alpha n=1 Tax=Candidatus Gottesmanbacteria bacterium RIFCSPHIGHO2_02_FULL_39_11 TaxID=1798382 RepID=A0A1F5ZWJ8_9BACT|nr:MAG: DNA-directed RNA polymerase subunit alpha [Candidatus Gottesmanbacteria bacterium RIFCSPHIGHO2_02_FULL_39_11]
MIEPKFTVKNDVDEKNYGKFVIEPLEQGYGHTLGNSIRRVLLTSLKGAGVTKVRIDGVKHPFSTLTGLKEDVIQLLLNIKKIRLKLDSDKPVTIRLSAKGATVVHASEIEEGEVEVINKDLYLGELTSSKAKLEIEMVVEPGYGYVTAEEREKEKELDWIWVDTLFSPVSRVNYRVESTRVGRMTNLDKLVLEIWTDGTITPANALTESSKILVSYFLQVYEPKAKATEAVAVTPTISDEILKMTLEELDLPTRIVNALHNGGIETIGQLLGTPKKDLMKIKNLGAKSVTVVEDILRKKGIALTV